MLWVPMESSTPETQALSATRRGTRLVRADDIPPCADKRTRPARRYKCKASEDSNHYVLPLVAPAWQFIYSCREEHGVASVNHRY